MSGFDKEKFRMNHLWQEEALPKLVNILKEKEEVECIILKGSYADDQITIDKWSDIDLLIFVDDNNIKDLFNNKELLSSFGNVFALVQVESPTSMVLRICFDTLVRFDLIFMKTSYLKNAHDLEAGLFDRKHKVLYSKVESINQIILNAPKSSPFSPCSPEEFNNIADKFWLLAVIAINKLVRGDYLIASHLALEMTQDCIVLQMISRDKEKGTNVHRTGEFEFVEILDKIKGIMKEDQAIKIIEIIKESCKTYDELATRYSKAYKSRYATFETWISDVYISE